MALVSIQIPRWLMHPEVWRFVGFTSAIVGMLCYALSTSFHYLFGNWNSTKIFVYIVFSFIICLATLSAKAWQHSASLRLRAHMAFLVLTITSVYSFFFDKAVNGKPDAYSVLSCAAFAMMSLSLSRQVHCGFEVDLLYFFLGVLIVQLMKIKLWLGMVGACFSYFLIILRSCLNFSSENECPGLQDQNHVVIPVDSQQSNTGNASIIAQLTACIGALQQRNSALIYIILYHVKEYSEAIDDSGLVTDHNLVIDALPSGVMDNLHEAAKSAVAVGFEKECFDAYSNCRRECLEECLSRLLILQQISIADPDTVPSDNYMIGRWIKASNVVLKILFPSERRLCDRVFFGLSSVADVCFMEICREATTQLLNFADAFVSGNRSMDRMFQNLDIFAALSDLIPEFESLFCDDLSVCLVNEAVTVQNRMREAITGSHTEMMNLISRTKVAKLVLPNGGVHPITHYAMRYILVCCRSRKKLEPVLQEYLKGVDGPGTRTSFSAEMGKQLELLEKKLKTKSKNYKDPALRCFFMMNNRRYIENKVIEWGLGAHLSDDWVQNNIAKVQQNLGLYCRNSWNKVRDYLELDNNESLVPNVAAESMKEKLNLFNSHFMEMCIVQSMWFVFDEQLREEIRASIKNMLLPAYGNFIGRIRNLLGTGAYEYIKYGAFDIEARLKDLFYGSIMNQWPTEK